MILIIIIHIVIKINEFQKETKIYNNESCELQTVGLRGIQPAFYNPESAAAKGLVSLAFADKQHSRFVIHETTLI